MENNEMMQEVAEPIVEEAVIEEAKPKKSVKDLLTNKTVLLAAGAAVVAVIVIVALLATLLSSTYKTPVKQLVDEMNRKKYVDPMDDAVTQLNGFTAGEFKAIFKILKSTEDYKDELDDRKDSFEDSIEKRQDEYGDNYKVSYKITDKDKLDKDDLKEFEDSIQERGQDIKDFVKSTKDDDFDWDDYADELGVTEKQAKTIVKKMEKIADTWKKADVKAGYELDIELTIKGKELDEPEEEEGSINVYKVNGKWLSEQSLYAFYYLPMD